jgi:hypothetical protein
MLLGSVAETVVRKASCPVVVVRPKDYHAFLAPEIQLPCPDSLRMQTETRGSRLWCDRHSHHYPRAHVHCELRKGFGGGSQLIHPE